MTTTERPSPRGQLDVSALDRWWRAANYLSVGQIYLLDNPLLREPLEREHVKPRLLGHWGTTPGLNFLHAHINRVIRDRDLEAMTIVGPGHGGPAAVANAWLEGTWSEVYSNVSRDEAARLAVGDGQLGDDITVGRPELHLDGHSDPRPWRANPITTTAKTSSTSASATAASGSVSRWR